MNLKNVGGGGCQKYFRDLKKNVYVGGGGWGGVMPKYFIDLKIRGGGGYANKLYELEKCWGGGMPKYFIDLKNVGWGEVCQQILWS